MISNTPLTQLNSFKTLREEFERTKGTHLKEFFSTHANRAQEFKLEWNQFMLDYSRNRISKRAMSLLLALAEESGLRSAIDAQFSGKKINVTENRAVLHTALRNMGDSEVLVDGEDVMPAIRAELSKIKTYSEHLISGSICGSTGAQITDVVNIGIGGSDLGPNMVVDALEPYSNHLDVHFVSNVDGAHLAKTLKSLNPETTLFIVVSKTFTTQETMANANSARQWLSQALGEESVKDHFVAVSTNLSAVKSFGIREDRVFGFWDWVGGRYSLWSAVGLSISLAVGFNRFEEMLTGAYEMDEHFRNASFDENMPVIMAMIGVYYNNLFECESQAILPYDQSLSRFAAFLQQADMESNGKSVGRDGQNLDYQTGPVIWGEPGTNGQHAFYQLIHQGTKLIPADFIAFAQSHYNMGEHHDLLMANFIAQPQALMNGVGRDQVISEMRGKGIDQESIDRLAPFKVFEGNRPSNVIAIKKLTPRNLGSLIALYEHKIFVQGVVWNVFSFDQWGVELGKTLARKIEEDIKEGKISPEHDDSTKSLISWYESANNID